MPHFNMYRSFGLFCQVVMGGSDCKFYMTKYHSNSVWAFLDVSSQSLYLTHTNFIFGFDWIADIILLFIISDVLYLTQDVYKLEVWLEMKNKYKVFAVTVSSQQASLLESIKFSKWNLPFLPDFCWCDTEI